RGRRRESQDLRRPWPASPDDSNSASLLGTAPHHLGWARRAGAGPPLGRLPLHDGVWRLDCNAQASAAAMSAAPAAGDSGSAFTLADSSAHRGAVPRLSVLHAKRVLSLTVGLLALLTGSAFADEARSTRIVAPLIIGEERCTIEIVADTVACFGSNVLFTAVLDCADGLVVANEPQWFLDGEPVGSGTEIELQPGPGAHLVEVSCGSCQDQAPIEISACSQHVHLDAAFSDDETEATTGIFLAPHIGPVNGLNFSHMRYGMRPFTLSADS